MRINAYSSWRAFADSEAIASRSAAVCESSAGSGSKLSSRIVIAPFGYCAAKSPFRYVAKQCVALRARSPCKERDEAGLVNV